MFFSQFPCYRAKDTGSKHLAGIIQQYYCIVVKSNITTVRPANLFFCPYNNCFGHGAFLNVPGRDSAFDANDNNIANGCIAPTCTAKKNDKGELVKQPFGPWMRSAFGLLAKMKGLRGTALDVFGKTEERRMERALIVEYRTCIDELLARLNTDNLALAVEIARIPEEIRGYGHVKERHLKTARPKWDSLMVQWRGGGQPQRHAA